MGQLTVKDLLKLCEKEIKDGNGDKKIVISDDNEGNGFHGLFCGFTTDVEFFNVNIYDSDEENVENLIILGQEA